MFSKHNSSKRKIIVFSAAALIIGFAGGLAAGFLARSDCGKDKTLCGDYNEGWKAARQKINNDGILPGLAGQTDSLSGMAKSIGGDRIVFTAPLLNPLDNESLRERTALITDQTEIVLHRGKTAADLNAEKAARGEEARKLQDQLSASPEGRELIAADKQINELSGQISGLRDKINTLLKNIKISSLWMRMQALKETRPDPFAYKKVSGKINDIKPGSSVIVIADGDIREKREFTAKKIVVNENTDANNGIPAIMPAETGGAEGLDASPYDGR